MSDPIEHAFEAEQFEMERDGVARSFGEACLMNPHPHVAQDEGHGDEEQSQARIACASVIRPCRCWR